MNICIETDILNSKAHLQSLVVNYFVTSNCNFSCIFCYSKWDSNCKKIITNNILEYQKTLIDNLYIFFNPESITNPLKKISTWNEVRLNISGGEPLLEKNLDKLIFHAFSLGFKISLITNASLLEADFINKVSNYLDWIGFSIDSCDEEINKSIGRFCVNGKTVSVEGIAEKVCLIKRVNPKIKIKVNTVVNKYNVSEDFSVLFDEIKPDKWTLVQMLPVVTKNGFITNEQFEEFVIKHIHYNPVVETNDDYINSFILVTPDGRFFSNGDAFLTGSYLYSEKINLIGADKAFSQIKFDSRRYVNRILKNANVI